MADLTLYTLALRALTVVVDFYDAEGESLPDRRYVADGLPAADCEQVTVDVRRTYPMNGDVLQETPTAAPFEYGRAAEIAVVILRCAPTVQEAIEGEVTIPTPEEIQTSAMAKLSDAELIPQAFREAYRDGDLPGCSGVAWLGWRSIDPEGGLTGGEVLMRLVID